jgi:hypothetical protein
MIPLRSNKDQNDSFKEQQGDYDITIGENKMRLLVDLTLALSLEALSFLTHDFLQGVSSIFDLWV